jgi:flagellar motor switch protein FliN/FliY
MVVPAGSSALEALYDVPMPLVIEIGRARLTVQEILQLGSGSVVELDRMVGELVDLYVSDRRIAQGEIVVVGEHYGVRIARMTQDDAGDSLS